MSAPDAIRRLVERFEKHQHEYRHHKNETELRREFLDPFFVALGWDVANEKDYDERHKEVVHEPSVEVAGQGKKADYAFRTGVDKFDFLVEAKKPSVSIESAPEPAYQLRRYGWSAKLPVNILTDFEHLAVYDCRQRPNPADKVAAGRILLIHYKEYETRWDEIAAIFSPEAVRRGAFEQYVAGTKGKKGTAEVDDVFLEEIERWRDLLARNIALRNPEVANERQLNYAVQMTIDRIIFLRICEDRGIEPEGQLRDIAAPTPPTPFGDDADTLPHVRTSDMGEGWGGGGVYAELVRLFKRADQKYNSGLFHFSKEKGWDSPEDTFTPGLLIDDKVLKDILRHLYYPDSPYAFSYLSADILGQVYERFLGKVIRLTAGHQAKVEEKPEVRKAGGVYYTPTYIVDYIVHNTVGKLLEGNPTPSTSLRASPGPFAEHPAGTPDGRTPSGEGRKMTPQEAAALKVLDPACGSGSFLLGAYQYLLDWHLAWYSQNGPEKWAQGKDPAITPSVPAGHLPHFPKENGGGRVGVSWRLTTAEKKRILLNNIHGVDIDAQAVEVTKLSLLLKVLEGETGQLTLGIERALPDLSRNIQCGNSLIGPDYYEDRQLGLGLFADEEERYRVNAFDWQAAFPQVFDLHRPAATSPKSDWGSSDLGEAGRGFDAVIGNPPYIRVRIFKEFYPKEAEYFESKYECATHVWDIYLLFFEKAIEILKQGGRVCFIVPIQTLHQPNCESLRRLLLAKTSVISIADLSQLRVFQDAIVKNCILVSEKSLPDNHKINILHPASPQELFREPIRTWPQSSVTQNPSLSMKIDLMSPKKLLCEKLESKSWRLDELCYVTFGLRSSAKGVGQGGKDRLITDDKTAPNAKPYLEGRDIKRFATYPTGRFIRYIPSEMYSPRIPELFENKKIVSQSMLSKMRLIATLDNGRHYVEQSLVCIIPHGIITEAIPHDTMPLEFILGILNSRLESFYFATSIIDYSLGGGLVHATPGSQSKLIIPKVSEEQIDAMVSLVERMLSLHKQSARTPQEKEMVKREIEAVDGQIDRLVYELYGLSEEEIKIVEGKT